MRPSPPEPADRTTPNGLEHGAVGPTSNGPPPPGHVTFGIHVRVSIIRDQLRRVMSVSCDPALRSFSATLKPDATFPGFSGHFPGQPVLPGVCLIQAVAAATETATGRSLKIGSIDVAKFFRPVRPEESVTIEGRLSDPVDGPIKVKAAATGPSGEKVAQITVTLRQVAEEARD